MSATKDLTSYPEERYSFKAYVTGFLLSLAATMAAYLLVSHNLASRSWAVGAVVAMLGLTQFFTQITLFLHLGQENKPKYRLVVFLFMTSVVLILVAGSIWIMNNLNYRMLDNPKAVTNYLNQQSDGL